MTIRKGRRAHATVPRARRWQAGRQESALAAPHTPSRLGRPLPCRARAYKAQHRPSTDSTPVVERIHRNSPRRPQTASWHVHHGHAHPPSICFIRAHCCVPRALVKLPDRLPSLLPRQNHHHRSPKLIVPPVNVGRPPQPTSVQFLWQIAPPPSSEAPRPIESSSTVAV